MKQIFLLILIVLFSGCAFSRGMTGVVGANGVKSKQYGELEEGSVLFKNWWCFTIGKGNCKWPK